MKLFMVVLMACVLFAVLIHIKIEDDKKNAHKWYSRIPNPIDKGSMLVKEAIAASYAPPRPMAPGATPHPAAVPQVGKTPTQPTDNDAMQSQVDLGNEIAMSASEGITKFGPVQGQ